jgi:hypothetical protein
MGPFGEETCRRRERSSEPLAVELLFDRLDKERAALARPHKPVNRFAQLLRQQDLYPSYHTAHEPHLSRPRYEILMIPAHTRV